MYDETCAHDVKFTTPPKTIAPVFHELANVGIICHYGHWVYGNNAEIICVDSRMFAERFTSWVGDTGKPHVDKYVNYAKHMLWKGFAIDSLTEKSYDYSENVAWGWAVGMLIEKLSQAKPYAGSPIVAQFHEWISGAALLYCRWKKLPIGTVFTTHATVLGRSLAAGGADVLSLSRQAKEQIPLSEAYRLSMEGKHQLEMQAAKNAHVFTTVSATVGEEVKYILGRKPDIVTVNGLDFEQAEKEAEVRNLEEFSRKELLQLIEACFNWYYPQKYDQALLTFISGRYEFTNKGFDIYIAAMGKLNARLKANPKQNTKRVFAFIFAPTSVKGPKISIIKNYLLLEKIHEILKNFSTNHEKTYLNLNERIALLSGTIRHDIETMAGGFVKDGDKPHINLYDLTYGTDDIIKACVSAGLTNAKDDVVKVLFYPTYLRPNDGLLNLNYYDTISGMDVGIFPSRYEPFGYTPLEAGLKMAISVSSDTTGFGNFIANYAQHHKCKGSAKGKLHGVKILHMADQDLNTISDELADYLEHIYKLDEKQLDKLKTEAYCRMKIFDWKSLIRNYTVAYSLALKRAGSKASV